MLELVKNIFSSIINKQYTHIAYKCNNEYSMNLYLHHANQEVSLY